MPALIHAPVVGLGGGAAENAGAVRQIVTASSDTDFLDQLIEGMRGTDVDTLSSNLDKLSRDRDADIERICTDNHREFVESVHKLDKAREDCTQLGSEILNLVQAYQASTDTLAEQKKHLVDSRNLRQNIDDSADALKESLDILRLSNQVHDLVAKQNHYAALRTLDELQMILRAREASQYKLGDMIEQSIPATRTLIADAVMADLNTWLYRIRDVSQYIGEVAFYQTEQRRTRQTARMETNSYIAGFRLNSAIELVADETEEYDVLNNEEAQVQVDFSPLFECLHIYEALGEMDRFRADYAVTRRKQKDLIIPSSLKLNDAETEDLRTLLESLAGFAIVERATTKKTDDLRTSADVDELWDSMCQGALSLISSSVAGVDDVKILLRVMSSVSLFIQTMETWNFRSSSLTTFLFSLFDRYVAVLKRRCNEDFEEIVATDDYMPMPINNIEEYDRITEVVWYTPDKGRNELTFPHVFPFSQMYPMCCIDIRNFVNQLYTEPDEYVSQSNLVDDKVKSSLDQMLCEQICQPLTEHLTSQYPGQIVQILTNMEHFERACLELQKELAEQRRVRRSGGSVTLAATEQFRSGRRKAEKRIFELVKSKIDDLIETAEYDWTSTTRATEPSLYMSELTRYLSNILSSVLLVLPVEIKDYIYFDVLSHASNNILTLILNDSIPSIYPQAVHSLDLDVRHLSTFITSLSPALTSAGSAATRPLWQTIEELSQTVALMASGDPDSFYDIEQRGKRYGAVDAQNGAVLLEKVERGKDEAKERELAEIAALGGAGGAGARESAGSMRLKATDRFGSVMRGLRSAGQGREFA